MGPLELLHLLDAAVLFEPNVELAQVGHAVAIGGARLTLAQDEMAQPLGAEAGQPVLSRLEAATGEEPTGPFRVDQLKSLYASPVAAEGRIYSTDLRGLTVVLSTDPEPKLLAANQLEDVFSASAALVDRELYLRGRRFLYCIANEP